MSANSGEKAERVVITSSTEGNTGTLTTFQRGSDQIGAGKQVCRCLEALCRIMIPDGSRGHKLPQMQINDNISIVDTSQCTHSQNIIECPPGILDCGGKWLSLLIIQCDTEGESGKRNHGLLRSILCRVINNKKHTAGSLKQTNENQSRDEGQNNQGFKVPASNNNFQIRPAAIGGGN